MHSFWRAVLVVVSTSATLCFGVAEATSIVVGFESGADSTFNYSGVDFVSTPYLAADNLNGYNTVAAHTGSLGVANNPNGTSPSSFVIAGGPATTFVLQSFVIAGAWGTQTLLIEGLNDGATLFSESLFVSLTPRLFAPNWAGIDELRISVGTDFSRSEHVDGDGQHWALDNLAIITASPVPEASSTIVLTLAGLAALAVLDAWLKRTFL